MRWRQLLPVIIITILGIVVSAATIITNPAAVDQNAETVESANRKANVVSGAIEPLLSAGNSLGLQTIAANFVRESNLVELDVLIEKSNLLISANETGFPQRIKTNAPSWYLEQQAKDDDRVFVHRIIPDESGKVLAHLFLAYQPKRDMLALKSPVTVASLSVSTIFLMIGCLVIATFVSRDLDTAELDEKEERFVDINRAIKEPFVPEDSKCQSELRANQMAAIVGQMGLGMALNLTCSALLFSVAYGQVENWILFTWTALMWLLSFQGLNAWTRLRNKQKPETLSKKTLRRVTANAFAMGSWWGVGFLLFFPYLTPTGHLIQLIVVIGVTAGATGIMAVVPTAMIAFSGTFLTLASIGMVSYIGLNPLIMATMVLVYGTAMFCIGATIYRNFAKSNLAQIRQNEQAQTIKLLLNDFEDTSSDWLWSTDVDGYLDRAPQEMVDALRLHSARSKSQTLVEALHALNDDPAAFIADKLSEGIRFRDEVFRTVDGEGNPCWISISAQPNKGGGFNGVAANVTAQYQAEIALAERTKKLETAVGELEQFAFVASHDLKEPLRKIEAFGSRLENKFGDQLGESGQHYIERMTDASTRMRRLIDDILNFSRISTRGKPFVEVNLRNIIAEVSSDLQIALEEKNGTIIAEQLPTIVADHTQMRQLLQNLVTNSLKFSKPDEPPVITISAEETLDSTIIAVKDNGIGFKQEDASEIFKIFHRLHGRSEYEGTGIGLATVRKIVDRHDGAIRAEGVAGEGATFYITMPRRAAPVVERQAA